MPTTEPRLHWMCYTTLESMYPGGHLPVFVTTFWLSVDGAANMNFVMMQAKGLQAARDMNHWMFDRFGLGVEQSALERLWVSDNHVGMLVYDPVANEVRVTVLAPQ